MTAYRLGTFALDDLQGILDHATAYSGSEISAAIEERLFSSFERLAAYPGLGSRRTDLTKKSLYFYVVAPYMVIYRKTEDPLEIAAVLHSSRNVKRILRART